MREVWEDARAILSRRSYTRVLTPQHVLTRQTHRTSEENKKTNQNGCRDRDDDATIHPPIRKKKRAQCTEYQLERKSVTMVKTAALPFIVFQQSITPRAPNETRCTHRCFGFTFQRLGASRASGLRGYDGNFLFFVFATGTAMESMVDTLKC